MEEAEPSRTATKGAKKRAEGRVVGEAKSNVDGRAEEVHGRGKVALTASELPCQQILANLKIKDIFNIYSDPIFACLKAPASVLDVMRSPVLSFERSPPSRKSDASNRSLALHAGQELLQLEEYDRHYSSSDKMKLAGNRIPWRILQSVDYCKKPWPPNFFTLPPGSFVSRFLNTKFRFHAPMFTTWS
ncbi:hypothetical protein M5K25_005105 [Dendrobium thyrsiflorum]|uniref:Uncharacterized protein n=1 Tax=Dendrobium thyrsiflorum TaxID=117978 RepID=A0ABD0VNR8_DENTH